MFEITYAAAVVATMFAVMAAAFCIRARRPVALTLGLYLGAAALWVGGNVAADVSYTVGSLYFTTSLALIGGLLRIILQFLLTDLIIDERYPSWPRFALYALPGTVLAAFVSSFHFIEDVGFPAGKPAEIVPGDLYFSYLILSWSSIFYCGIRLLLALRHERRRTRRLQLMYVFGGLILAGMLGSLFTTILPVFFGEFRFYSLGPLCSSVFFGLGVGYAITKHQFLDIRIIIQRGLLYTVVIASIGALYVSFYAIVLHLVQVSSSTALFWSGALATTIGVFSAIPFERWFRMVTDPWFFKGQYDYADVMHELSRIPQETGDFDELVSKLERTLTEALRASFVTIALSTTQPLGMQEAERFPIELEGKMIGYVVVGARKSDDAYTAGDRKLLTTFANQAATALSRVRLYKEVERHAGELERKVNERTRELKALQEEQRQMMTELSHNLQTPLAILQARLDQSKGFVLKDGERRELGQTIQSLSGFIYDLLSLAKLERTTGLDDAAPFSLSELVASVVEEVTVIAQARGITVASSIMSGITLTGNERAMRQALLNIAGNAVKYMGDGPERSISFTLAHERGCVLLSVKDTGLGIRAEDLPHVFERFYRGERTYGDARGTGLGLAITKRIVEQHAGTIDIESGEGVGTTVTLSFPKE